MQLIPDDEDDSSDDERPVFEEVRAFLCCNYEKLINDKFDRKKIKRANLDARKKAALDDFKNESEDEKKMILKRVALQRSKDSREIKELEHCDSTVSAFFAKDQRR